MSSKTSLSLARSLFWTVEASRTLTFILLGSRKLKCGFFRKSPMQDWSAFLLKNKSLPRFRHIISILVASIYESFMFSADTTQFGQSAADPLQPPRLWLRQLALQSPWYSLGSCPRLDLLVSRAQSWPQCMAALREGHSMPTGWEQTLLYRYQELHKGFASWWCPQLCWK